MRTTSSRRATYEDIVELPEQCVGEIVDGELYASPRPAPLHLVVASSLGGELYGAFHSGRSGPGGWWILDEPELHFGDDVLVPDIAGWRRSRMEVLPEAAYFSTPPDWICEVLSPSTARVDLVKKLPRYAAAGIGYAWIVNPAHQTVECLLLENGRWILNASYSGSDVIREAPFDEFSLELGRIWPEASRGE